MSVPPSGPYIPQVYNASDPDVKVSDMQAALSSYELLLPSQTGNGGKYLTTDGTAKSWATIDLSTKQDAAAFLTTLVGIGGTSGSGNLARVTSPTFITPVLGVATGTSLSLSASSQVLYCGASSGTLAVYQQFQNGGGRFYQGVESSAGGGIFTGGTAYATVFGSGNSTPVQFATNNTVRQTISAAGDVTFTGNVTASGTVRLGTYTVGTIPSAASNTRARAFVTDSNLAFNSTNLGSTVTAGGSALVPVFSNGTNWVIG